MSVVNTKNVGVELGQRLTELIYTEQDRQNGKFIHNISIDLYIGKIKRNAEFISINTYDRCRGFIAFYCNDLSSKIAFITLILVNPVDRGKGLGEVLVSSALLIAKKSGFVKCQLHVRKNNAHALGLYERMGFKKTCAVDDSILCEIIL